MMDGVRAPHTTTMPRTVLFIFRADLWRAHMVKSHILNHVTCSIVCFLCVCCVCTSEAFLHLCSACLLEIDCSLFSSASNFP